MSTDNDGITNSDRRNVLKKMLIGTLGLAGAYFGVQSIAGRNTAALGSLAAVRTAEANSTPWPSGYAGKGYGCAINDTANGNVKSGSDSIGMKLVRARGWYNDNYVSSVYPESQYYTTLVLAEGVQRMYGSSWTLSDWNSYVTDMFNSRPYVHSWEIWNEPQVASYRTGYLNQTNWENAYYNLVKNAYTINRQLRPNANDLIWASGGIFIYEDWAIANYYNKGIWLNSPQGKVLQSEWNGGGVGANALASYCTGISVHAYSNYEWLPNDYPIQSGGCCPGTKSVYTLGQIWTNMLNAYYNLTGKPFAITECGLPNNYSTSYVTDTQTRQANFLDQAFNLFAGRTDMDLIHWYNLVGLSNVPTNSDFGLFNSTTYAAYPDAQQFANYALNKITSSSSTSPTVSVSPTSVSRSTNPAVDVTLNYWPASDYVTVKVYGSGGSCYATIYITCNSSGYGTGSFKVPTNAGTGYNTVEVTDSSGHSASCKFMVTN